MANYICIIYTSTSALETSTSLPICSLDEVVMRRVDVDWEESLRGM